MTDRLQWHLDEHDGVHRREALADFDLAAPIRKPHLDAICRHIAAQCDVPIALVSLVDTEEQRFIGRAGTDMQGTARSTSFCASAMLDDDILEVLDATKDPRFSDFDLVTGDAHIRYYAGAPLVSEEGFSLGALCIMDRQPRAPLSPERRAMLKLMATCVMDRLTLRQTRNRGRIAANTAARALDESEMRFRTLADAMPQMVWSTTQDGISDYFNARWYEFTGVPFGASDDHGWTDVLHPDDRERTTAVWSRCLATGEPYEIEYRMRGADGEYRWALARGLPVRDEEGRIARWFGTCTDIHEQKRAMEEREIISHELSHRIKNIFAVISGLISFSTREHPELKGATEMLSDRILALGRAHDFVRPQGLAIDGKANVEKTLKGLLGQLFAPYEPQSGERITVRGTDLAIDERSATPLALLFHELATNSAKYGALSSAEGHVDLDISEPSTDDGRITLIWRERGGPAITTPNPEGFGSQLLDLSIRRQLEGDYTRQWHADGLEMRIELSSAHLLPQRS